MPTNRETLAHEWRLDICRPLDEALHQMALASLGPLVLAAVADENVG